MNTTSKITESTFLGKRYIEIEFVTDNFHHTVTRHHPREPIGNAMEEAKRGHDAYLIKRGVKKAPCKHRFQPSQFKQGYYCVYCNETRDSVTE